MAELEITALAHGYAEEVYNTNPDAGKVAESVTCLLSRRFCLVEKDTVRKAFWQLTDKLLSDGDNKSFGAAYVVLQSLFPEIAKEVEE